MWNLTAKQKVGQRFAVGFPSAEISEDFVQLVKEYKIGNVILFKENIVDNQQLRQLCQEIQKLIRTETGYPAFITIDQEGGVVSRLGDDAAVVPSAMAISATGNVRNAYEAGRITATELAALGINFNLAPVMDINSNSNNPVIGVRSYGDTPETVSEYGVQMITGLLDGGVLCSAKHFPGHGDTAVDSHLSLPIVDKSLEELAECELKSFMAAIHAGVPAIMTSHILFPQLEKEKVPATMSRPIITGLLKEKMGFQGLVLSDCMMMNAIQGFYGTVQGSLAAAKAGVDLIFISHSRDLASQSARAMLEALDNGELDAEEMDASVQKILAYKQKYADRPLPPLSLVGCKEHRDAVGRMMDEAITEVQVPQGGRPALGASPLFLGCYPFRPTLVSNPEDRSICFPLYLQEQLGGDCRITSIDPDAAEIASAVEATKGHTCLVIGTYNGHLKQGQMALVQALSETGIPTICTALRNTYDLVHISKNVYALAAYSYDKSSLAAVFKVLSGQRKAVGKLPIKL